MILTLNSGSSSLKFSLYDKDERRVFSGILSGIRTKNGKFQIKGEKEHDEQVHLDNHEKTIDMLLKWLGNAVSTDEIKVVGHRIVHGGSHYVKPQVIDDDVVKELERLAGFAPLHLPPSIETLKAARTAFPGVPHIACFDTSFHRRMPEVAKVLPLTRELYKEGVEKFGFHGLSYEFILHQLKEQNKELWRKKLIIAHLGNGCSLAAVREGHSVDTTMGFSPAGGMVMGTRCGDIDAGLISYFCDTKGHSASEFVELVNKQSGLLGLSGLTSDMQTLLAEEEKNQDAKLAVDIFCYHATKHIGALSAVLGGIDALIFTGGIGENAHQIRERICRNLAHLGIVLDAKRNAEGADLISADGGTVQVLVIETNEELMIALHCKTLVPQ